MARMKRDERTCPYCAEIIKAAATRCRYCYSDLTPQSEATEPPATKGRPKQNRKDQSEQKEKKAEKGEKASAQAPGDSASTRRFLPGSVRFPRRSDLPRPRDVPSLVLGRLRSVLVVLIVIAAAGVGVSWWSVTSDSSSTTAPDGALVGEEARTQVVVAAADLSQRALSYSHESLENDMETARARMTPEFREEYDATMEQVRSNTLENEIVLEASVVSSAIIEATEQEATVLVFLNQTTTAGTGDDQNQQLNQNSLVVTLERDDGEWAMSNMSALG